LRVADSSEARVDSANFHGNSMDSATFSVGIAARPNVSGPNLSRNDEMGPYVDQFRSSVQAVSTQTGCQWQYGDFNQPPNIGGDAYGQFNWDIEMDFPPNAGSADIANGDLFEDLDNWW
jgi:hypothetical protein